MNNSEIQRWLDNPAKDYREGVALLEKYSSNPRLVRVYANSSPRFQLNNLVGDLRRLLSVPEKNVVPQPTTPAAQKTSHAPRQPKSDMPAEIQAKVEKAGKLWVKICKTHTELFNVGESNSPEAVAKRKELLEKRVPEIEEYEKLWADIKAYQDTKQLPAEKTAEPTEENKELSEMPTKELINMRQSLRMKITRANNQLEYQSKTKLSKKNPMPDGPKKDELTEKIKGCKATLDQIETILAKR